MAAGDVEIRIVNVDATGSAVDTALTAMRVTAGANGKYGVCPIDVQGLRVLIWAITEA